MNTLKKIFSIFMISGLLVNSLNISYASDSRELIQKNIYYSSKSLDTKSLKRLDNGISSIEKKLASNDAKSKLQAYKKIKNNIESAIKKSKNAKNTNTLKYLSYSIDKLIFDLEKYISENPIANIDSMQLTKVNKAIMDLQGNIASQSKNYIDKYKTYFDKYTSYTETGNMQIDLALDEENIGKINTNLKFNNYIAKANMFDSQVSGNLDFKLKTDLKDTSSQKNIDMTLKAFIDMISKDSDMYLLVKDLDVNMNDSTLKEKIDLLKKEFSDNKYIKIPSESQSKEALNLIKQFTPNKAKENIDSIMSKPLLEVYNNYGDKFLLQPTKYACDKYFELNNSFSFYNSYYEPETCTDTVYKAFLKEFQKNGVLYISLGETNNTLGYVIKEDNTKGEIKINYDSKNINKIDVIITPDQKKYKGEGLTLNYEKNKLLNFNFNADSGDYTANFTSILNSDNKFTKIDGKIYVKDQFNGNYKLENNQISGDFKIIPRFSFYEFSGKISGNTTNDNKISKLNISILGIQGDESKFLDATFNYDNKNYTFSLNANEENSGKFELSSTGTIDDMYFKTNNIYSLNNQYIGAYSGTLNMEYDLRNNKDISKIFFNLKKAGKEIVNFNIKNNGNIEYKNTEIKTPSEYKEMNQKLLNQF